jgi:SAM-dependent methyltransferase
MLLMFEKELRKINGKIEKTQQAEIPNLFRKIPLETFGKLLLDIPSQYPHIKAFFPTMSSNEVQDHWTGNHGDILLGQSLAFMRTMLAGYGALTGKKIENARVLDFGCGWGRLIRLFYKYVPIDNIYGVDPWDESIKECKNHGVKANLAISDWVPRSLPFELKFDLIFAFSVFTHLSEKTTSIVLDTLSKYIANDGLLIITIRSKEYWHIHNQGASETKMIKIHDKKDYAFMPHELPPVDGDITYGDASISIEYFEKNITGWRVESVEFNEVDQFQVVLFLKPV